MDLRSGRRPRIIRLEKWNQKDHENRVPLMPIFSTCLPFTPPVPHYAPIGEDALRDRAGILVDRRMSR
jgi:hypothetical protein